MLLTTSEYLKKERRHIKIETPENWEILYSNILEMRKDKTAPVDSMGCEKVQEMSTDPKVQRYHCLVSLMLSSQTKVCILCMSNHGPLHLDRSVCLPLFAMWPSFGYFSTVI